MNQATQEKILEHSSELFKMAEFLASNPDKDWIFQLLDEPFKLAVRIIELGVDSDCYELARQLGVNWQTVKQIQGALR